MSRIFSRMRRLFIGNRQFLRYLSYAIGEILLVVIGILIAVSINNRNEFRKEREKEKVVLTNLRVDFERNIASLERYLEGAEIREEYIEAKMVYFNKKETELNAGAKDTLCNTGFQMIAIIDGTLSSILSGEKLELIQDDSLKYRLTQYPALLEEWNSQQSRSIEVVTKVERPILESYINLGDRARNQPGINIRDLNLTQSDYTGLLKDRDYQNSLFNVWYQFRNGVWRTENLLEESRNILKLIDADLNRLNEYFESF